MGLALIIYACSPPWRSPVAAPAHPDPRAWSPEALTIAYIGHATVLIDLGGTRILTDPAFFSRIGAQVAGMTVGPRRVVQAALTPEELPPIDAVLVTHAHMDSLDRPSLRRVAAAPLLVIPRDVRDLVQDLGFARVAELGWGEQIAIAGVTIEAVPVNHWGRRWPLGKWRGYNGYLLTKGDRRLLFASDTAYTEAFQVLAREPPIEVAMFGIGAYDPWIMNHADPEQAWRMFRALGACYLLPVHFDTFRLGKEPLGEAMARLLAAAGTDAERIAVRRVGETFVVPRNGCGTTHGNGDIAAAAGASAGSDPGR